jgi:multicomponent Na+:H+ antiporter subunit F
MNGDLVLVVCAALAMAMLVVGLALCLVRLARGPGVLDRVVAVDLFSTLAVGIIGVYALVTSEPLLLRAAAALALVSFLGTVAFASFVERHEES